jgi:RNA 2',3'-cyclic 3'-phosphodiesterase
MIRLFIAILLPQAVENAVESAQEHIRALDTARSVRWTEAQNIHLTLKFLGDTDPRQVDIVSAAMGEAAQGFKPFSLSIAGLGGFPNLKKPRIVWAGVHGELDTLHGLRDAVERTVSPLGYPTEDRPFSPHLTLGRSRREAGFAALNALGTAIAALDVGEIATWRVSKLSLMRSDLRPEGAIYKEIAKVTLGNS